MHLNSLIQCRTISVDLTSNILRKQLSTTYWRDAVSFKRLGTASYSPSIVTITVSLAISEILSVKEWPDLEI